MTSTTAATKASSPKAPEYPPKPRQYQSGKTLEYGSEHEPKYGSHEIHGYHHDEKHGCQCTPRCGPEFPPYQPGLTQCRLDPGEVKGCLEKCSYENSKCYKPPCRPQGKYPVTKECKPEYAHKPEYADTISQLKPNYNEHPFEHQTNESLHIWPHCTVGNIWVGANDNYLCPLWTGTGALVGCDLLLTASHTVPWGRKGWWMRFAPGFSEGSEPFGSSYVMDVRGYETSATSADDFVVCKLYKPLGETCGWMGVDGWSVDHHYTGSLWNMVGYSEFFKNGEVQFFEGDEKVKKVKGEGGFKLLDTHADHWGWCGGVLWGWRGECPCAIGVLSGKDEEICKFIPSGWAGGPGLVDLVNWAWTNWE
jgi:hypothetical protein